MIKSVTVDLFYLFIFPQLNNYPYRPMGFYLDFAKLQVLSNKKIQGALNAQEEPLKNSIENSSAAEKQ
jgi:hypothetical protein